jgi:hypothetical protein
MLQAPHVWGTKKIRQRFKQLQGCGIDDPIKDCLSFATRGDNSIRTQPGKVLRQG